VGVPIQKENEARLDSEVRGEENGEEVSPPHPTMVWESFMSSSSGVRGGAPTENGFIVI